MQNRRLLKDDSRGVREPLNETEADGRGVRVNANYYVNIFGGRNQSKVSPQREQ